jgi:hydroxymethylglutaryl-CoA lyase
VNLPERVTIYEVGPRDGLQNESRQVPTADKIAFIDGLVNAGIRHIEITSFVSPKWIPQLADSAEVARGVTRREGVQMSALVPNRQGLETALASGMKEIAVFLSASETHNKKNVNKTIAETLKAFDEVIPRAVSAGVAVRAYISTVFGCPYEGEVASSASLELTRHLRSMGVYQVSLSDTIGVANPKQVERIVAEALALHPVASIAVHFHDTQGTALANCLVALNQGVTTIDSSAGGLGGCPYAPGASGNLATDDLVAMLHGMGIETGIDLDKLVDASRQISACIGQELPSRYLKAHVGKQARSRRRAEMGESR